MIFNKLSIRFKLTINNSISIFLFLILSFVLWTSLKTLSTTANWVEHTYKVIRESNGLINAMVDQETGLRGFTVAGQEDYLEPYVSGRQKFQEHFKTVKQLTSDNPIQQTRLDEVNKVAESWITYAERMIEMRRDIKKGDQVNTKLKTLIASGIGKQKMDGIRRQIQEGNFGDLGPLIINAMINMETGLRGFMLNRKEEFLEPFDGGKSDAENLYFQLGGSKLKSTIEEWINNYALEAIGIVREANKFQSIDQIYSEFSKKKGKIFMDDLRQKISIIIDEEQQLMSVRQKAASDASSSATGIVVLGSIIISIVIVSIGVVISNSISRPIREALEAAGELSDGNLTIKIDERGTNEVALILNAIQTIANNLSVIINKLSDASAELGKTSNDLSQVTEASREGSNEQLLMMDQVAVAITEMLSAIQDVSQSASVAANFANDAKEEASNGNRIILDTINTINKLEGEITSTSNQLGDLEKKTNDIDSILDVIRDISDQTNLLALNAAIEAARAGEQGRGFAVVADEVRTLAKRTQGSTAEIQSLIENLQRGTRDAVSTMEKSRTIVKESVTEVTDSGAAFNKISETIGKINDMNMQIASASEQQSTTAEEINRNVISVNQVVKSGSTNIDTTVNSSQSVSSIAHTFKEIIQIFKV